MEKLKWIVTTVATEATPVQAVAIKDQVATQVIKSRCSSIRTNTSGKISYDEVVALYLSDGATTSNEYLIKYSHGPSQNPSGTLAPGNSVRVKDGMRFRVSGTGES